MILRTFFRSSPCVSGLALTAIALRWLVHGLIGSSFIGIAMTAYFLKKDAGRTCKWTWGSIWWEVPPFSLTVFLRPVLPSTATLIISVIPTLIIVFINAAAAESNGNMFLELWQLPNETLPGHGY
jgi:hypothetical protein